MAEAKPKFTAAEVKEHIKNIQTEIEKQKKALKKDRIFVAITPEQTEEKLKRVNSPMITTIEWNNTRQGGIVNVEVTVYNPDPTTSYRLFLHAWVGSGNIDPNVGTFLLNADARFPRFTIGAPSGFSVAPRVMRTLEIPYRLPVDLMPFGIDTMGFLGNICLMHVHGLDVGTYLDRGAFPFRLT